MKIRSLLFVPGDSERKFQRALTSAADALILDLEDSVAADQKEGARHTVRASLESDRNGKKLFVRVNALDTGLTLGDLAAVVPGRPDGIMLPKCQNGEDANQVSLYLDAFESAAGIPLGTIRLLPIGTETAASIFGLGSYKGATSRLWGLMWGAEDLAATLGSTTNRDAQGFTEPYRMARNLCLAGAAGADLVPVDTVYTDIDNLEGLAKECAEARRDGFLAKAVIHPKHIDAVNEAFTPKPEEIEWARKVVAAFKQDGALGVIKIDGKMIDKPHLVSAERILSLAGAA